MGKKQSTIANKLRLLKLGEKVRKICLENNLTERHARSLLAVQDEELQLKIIDKVIKDGLNVKKTEELINKELLKLEGESRKKKSNQNIRRALPAKLYVNTIKQVFQKFSIPAEYTYKDDDDFIEVRVKIPKNK